MDEYAESLMSELNITGKDYVMVAAIDVGTTYSGYAFSFVNTPNDICMNKNWGESLGYQSYKTPTSVLTGPDHDFIAFGHEAEEKYAMPDEDSGDLYMYKHFKMILHQSKHLTRGTTIMSINGHIRPAMDIFVMAIKYLKEHLLDAVDKQTDSELDASLVRWVITVPAIWSEGAKSFMREAAFKAGCIPQKDSRHLILALEPEAASLHCRQLDIGNYVIVQDLESLTFRSKTKYLVIDAGGGTVDITAHKVLLNGKLKELHIANGGSWGGTKVDENFINLLKRLFGDDFLDDYKKQCPHNWLSMMTAFQTLKRSVKAEGKNKIALPLSWSLASKYMEWYNQSIEKVFTQNNHLGVSFQNGAVVLSHDATIILFKPVTEQIANHVQELIKLPALQPLSYVLLVGGFGESTFLQKAIQGVLPTCTKLLVPSEAQLSVMRGAVQFGQNADQIEFRISRKSFGYECTQTFIEGVHDENKKILTDAGYKCTGLFHSVVKKGESIQYGKVIKSLSLSSYVSSVLLSIEIYSTENDDLGSIEYVDDPKFEKLGEFIVSSPENEKRLGREIEIQIEFSDTEMHVNAIDLSSGNTADTILDLL